MPDLASLALHARTSEGGEAYLPIAKGPGYRLGIGARVGHGRPPNFFVEVVLDLVPHRPDVDPGRLAERAALLERFRDRGYSLSCDDAGVVTCEQAATRNSSAREIRAASALLARRSRKPRSRPRS